MTEVINIPDRERAKDALILQLSQGRDKLAARVEALEQLMIDAQYVLDGARVWNGMGWTYIPLHPIKYVPMRDKFSAECDRINDQRAALKENQT